jgi:hypothetical protein
MLFRLALERVIHSFQHPCSRCLAGSSPVFSGALTAEDSGACVKCLFGFCAGPFFKGLLHRKSPIHAHETFRLYRKTG